MLIGLFSGGRSGIANKRRSAEKSKNKNNYQQLILSISLITILLIIGNIELNPGPRNLSPTNNDLQNCSNCDDKKIHLQNQLSRNYFANYSRKKCPN